MKKKQLFALAMAGVMGAGLLAGCGKSGSSAPTSGSTSGSNEETTEMVWMIRGDEPKNYDSVMAAVNEKLKEHLKWSNNKSMRTLGGKSPIQLLKEKPEA